MPNPLCGNPAGGDVASGAGLSVNYRAPGRTGVVAPMDRDLARSPYRYIDDFGGAASRLYPLIF
jgi:hypothetical protein